MKIIEADLCGKPDMPKLRKLENFDKPAVSRYSATTPDLLAWFGKDDAYEGKIKPFNFLLVGHAKKPLNGPRAAKHLKSRRAKPLASFKPDAGKVSGQIFNRNTGKLLPAKLLKT